MYASNNPPKGENTELHMIEYFGICLPLTLKGKERGLANEGAQESLIIKVLSLCTKDSTFDNKVIQTIIDYKW
jgi:hypothetical protein